MEAWAYHRRWALCKQRQVSLLLNFAEIPSGETNAHVRDEHPSPVTPSCMPWKQAKAAASILARLANAKTDYCEEKTSSAALPRNSQTQHLVMLPDTLGTIPRKSFQWPWHFEVCIKDPLAPSNLSLILQRMNGDARVKSSVDSRKRPRLSLSLTARSLICYY